MASSKLAHISQALDYRKREYIMQVIPVKHELWLAGIKLEPADFLRHVQEQLEVTNPKPLWAAEVLHIIAT